MGARRGCRTGRARACTRPSLEDVFLEPRRADRASGACLMSDAPQPGADARPPHRATSCARSPRTPIAVFFTLALPLIMLVLFNALFGGNDVDTGSGTWPLSQFYTGGLAAFTAVSATFTNLANVVPIRRDEGVLKRWRGTPLPTWMYLGGLIGSAVAIAAAGVAADARPRRRRLRPRRRRGQGAGGGRHVPRRRARRSPRWAWPSPGCARRRRPPPRSPTRSSCRWRSSPTSSSPSSRPRRVARHAR